MRRELSSRDAVIVSAVRTAVGRARKGSFVSVRPDDLAATAIREVVRRTADQGFDPNEVEDVILGCAIPEAEQGLNMARLAAIRAGLPISTAGVTVNRFCSSGLQAIAQASFQILSGQAEVLVAGGSESMSMIPMTSNKFSPNPFYASQAPQAYTPMGLTAENVAALYNISRKEQDEFALRSHQLAYSAVQSGRFDEQIAPQEVEEVFPGENGKTVTRTFIVHRDEGPRADTSLESLGKLRPAFKAGGTVTAGNASQMSDGAAAVLIMSYAKASALGLKPLARFVSFAVAGVQPELMGIGPIAAIPKALQLAGLSLDAIDLIELNEAFASQCLAVIRELLLPLEKVNVNGGAIALGHPMGATGAKLATQLVYDMPKRGARFGMISMCVGGGMGAAGIIENLQ
jgi:acetyl-CoA acyltransferase